MIGYMQRHERALNEVRGKDLSAGAWGELLDHHAAQIRWMQHERLVHLIVTLFVCLFALLTLGFTVINPSLAGFSLTGLLLILAAAYLIHYYRLENRLQRWYDLANELRSRRLAAEAPPSAPSGHNPA